MTLNARALSYAILVSLVISLTCGVLVLLSDLHTRELEMYLQEQRLIRNLESGIALLLSGSVKDTGVRTIDLFGYGQDPVRIRVEKWGCFLSASVCATGKNDSLERNMLLGVDPASAMPHAVLLPDLKRPLVLEGPARITGSAVLPAAGVIRGKGNTAFPLVQGPVRKGPPFLPATDTDWIRQLFGEPAQMARTLRPDAPLTRSFSQTTLTCYVPNGLLNDITASGNVILVADEPLRVSAGCRLEDVILRAPEIVFEDGFEGRLQAFAWREIRTGEHCRFSYPSVLAVVRHRPEPETSAQIRIGQGTELQGSIRMSAFPDPYARHRVFLGENTSVTGQVWAEGEVDLRGNVTGNITCNLFVREASRGRRENVLSGATIDRTGLPEKFAAPVLFPVSGYPKMIAQWLH